MELDRHRRVKLLAFAYACEPEEGSEPGVGWMWARMLARYGDTWVLTRANNRERIDAALGTIPEREALHFVYVDLPARVRFWKRGTRGIRSYYLLWQLAALREARRLQRSERFDLVWHVTLASAWLGSAGALVGPPFVFGPVGGGVGPPWRLVPSMGVRATLFEVSRGLARVAGRYLNPLARLAWRRARSILVLNQQTADWLPHRYRQKIQVFPHAILSGLPDVVRPSHERHRVALFAGRLLPWKGVDLAIGAIGMLPDWRLLICGKGPDELRLRRLAADAGSPDRIVFLGWLPRHETLRLMREEAGVFLFPSLHDDSPWVIIEALAAGLPIVCLDRGGPPFLADGYGLGVPVSGGRRVVIGRLATALDRAPTLPMYGAREVARAFEIESRWQMLGGVIDLVRTPKDPRAQALGHRGR